MAAERALAFASKYSYFTYSLSKSKDISLKLGHSGSLFQENIRSEWLHSNVLNREGNVHLYNYNGSHYNKEDFLRSFKTTHAACNGKYPFGIAESYISGNDQIDVGNTFFKSISSIILSSTMFLPSCDALQYYLYWQRQRKLWWKKISAFPSRFKLSEVNVIDKEEFSVDIFAEYSWGNQILENITISPMNHSTNKTNDIDVSAITKICNKMPLNIAVVGLFCDAFNEDLLQNSIILKLNRRLTPYKCIFAIDTNSSQTEELSQLGFYLNRLFKKSGIPTLLLPDSTTLNIDAQFERNDEWGIPYTVVLQENCLKSGIIGLRNRDTTLQEDVHVSELTDYIPRLFNNFKK